MAVMWIWGLMLWLGWGAIAPVYPATAILPPSAVLADFAAAIAPVETLQSVGERPIAQARQQMGAVVTVTGWVTVPRGQFSSAMLDQGFALADASGGLYVSTDEPVEIAVGDALTVTGTMGDDGHGQRILVLKTWRRLPSVSPGSLPPPRPSTTQQAGDLDGQLVTVTGTVSRGLVDDGPYGDRLWLADDSGEIQIYLPRSTHIEPHTLPYLQPGQRLQVTGFSSQYDGSDEVIPRFPLDLQSLN